MILRHAVNTVFDRLEHVSSLALLGPRQVGKTTLAWEISHQLPSVYLDLENRLDRQKVANLEAFCEANPKQLIILDEVQHTPEIFAPVRGIIDAARRAGRRKAQFLFLGSASIDLLRQSSESLAGRISYIEMHPISTYEFSTRNFSSDRQNQLWLRGGFPDSVLAANDKRSLQWRYDFIRTYLERDIPQLGARIPATTMERFWTMLAHNQGGTANASKLAGSLEVSNMSVSRYIDLLHDLLLVRKLPPYAANVKKRLVKSPRVYVRDSGLVHALLHIGSLNDLLGHPVMGKSWEGFVIENIATHLPEGVSMMYYRTSAGAEIDLVLEFSSTERWAIEIKYGPKLPLKRGFFEACKDITPTEKMVVYAGGDDFPLPNDVQAVSLMSLLKRLDEI